jgi:hypothetical protein
MKRSAQEFRVQSSGFGFSLLAATLKLELHALWRFQMKKLFLSGLMIVALGASSVFAQNANAAKKTKPAATTGAISGGGSATAGGTASGGTMKKKSSGKKKHPKRKHRRHSKKS